MKNYIEIKNYTSTNKNQVKTFKNVLYTDTASHKITHSQPLKMYCNVKYSWLSCSMNRHTSFIPTHHSIPKHTIYSRTI